MKNTNDIMTIEPCLYSRDNSITKVNKEFTDFLGFTENALLGKSLIEIGAIIRINTQILLENINGKYSGYIFTKSLEVREVNISVSHIKGTNEKIYTFVEIPNSRLEDKLMFEKQILLDNIVGVAIYSVPDLILVKVNQKYLDLIDFPFNEDKTSIGLSIREIVTGYVGTESEVITNTVIETQKSSYRKEIKFETIESGITYWDITRTPIFEKGRMKYILVITSDVTERVLKNKRIERQNEIIEEQNHDITEEINNQRHIKNQQSQLLMIEKEKRESLQEVIKLKNDFLYLITHELKTPMAVINLALQAIELICKDEVTETVDKYLKVISQNTNRQLRLVNNLLDITRLSSSELKTDITNFNIVYVVESIVSSVQLYAEQKNVNLKFTTNLSKKNIYFDEEKIERILLNLLSNALKFTSSGKSIAVNLSMKKRENTNMISISVHDEGLGISEDKQKIIFERFGQADTTLSKQAEGTGLGLYLVKLLVDILGGEISLKSQVGKGSTFTVLLPIIKPTIIDEVESGNKVNSKLGGSDRNVIQTAKIEFSDIYF